LKRGGAKNAEKDAEWKKMDVGSPPIWNANPNQTKRISPLLSATSAPPRFNFSFQAKRGGAKNAEKDAEGKIMGYGFPIHRTTLP
jgi:hypothetical protein